MAIELIIEPRQTYTWEKFKSTKPPYSIALDGIVSDITIREPEGPYANFDHHSGVDHLCVDGFVTRSTCGQVTLEINTGLYKIFKKDGEPKAQVYINDVDPDAVTSWFLLKNHGLLEGCKNFRKVNRLIKLIDTEDYLDSTGGTFTTIDPKMIKKMLWMFNPYYSIRYKGGLGDLDEKGMRDVAENIYSRITRYLTDGGEELSLRGQYEEVNKGGHGWSFIKEKGPAARFVLSRKGISAYVILVGMLGKNYIYALSKESDWIRHFDLEVIYNRLNDLEPKEIIIEENMWNGNNLRGGSPRNTGSTINPRRLRKVINDIRNKK